MEIVIIVNFFAILFAFLEGKKIIKNGLFFAFSLLFIFLAIRYNYGNDYKAYYEGFNEINSYASVDILDSANYYFEPGWILLCQIFEPFGFFSLIAFLSLINCITYYKLIKEYVPSEYYWFAIFVYVFDPSYLLVHLTAVRQALAIQIFIYSIKFILNRNLLKYTICILLASTFHTSAYYLLPLYLLNKVKFTFKGKYSILALFVYFLLFQFGNFLKPYLEILIAATQDKYAKYEEFAEFNTGIGGIINTILLGFIFFTTYENKDKIQLGFNLSILAFLFLPLGLLLSMIGRISMYLSIFFIIIYPLTAYYSKSFFSRYFFYFLVFVLTIYNFIVFFNSPVWKDDFSNYQTIFSEML